MIAFRRIAVSHLAQPGGAWVGKAPVNVANQVLV
jgi:hypothetical protein